MAGKGKAAPGSEDTGGGKGSVNNKSIPKIRGENNGKLEDSSDLFEIRRAGAVICFGHIPNLGYAPETLKDMARNGMHLYRNGKRVKP